MRTRIERNSWAASGLGLQPVDTSVHRDPLPVGSFGGTSMILSMLALLRQLLLGVILFTPLERLWPARPGQPLLRPGLALDLGYAALGPLLVGPVVGLALVGFAALMPPVLADSIAAWPWGMRLTFALLLAELSGYGVHRALHAHLSTLLACDEPVGLVAQGDQGTSTNEPPARRIYIPEP